MPTTETGRDDALVGRVLEGRYRILERIARGGMSTVYAAVDDRLDRLVAVKVMAAALSADPKFSDRFAREARAAARLTHLNVVAVYDQGHDRAPDGHHVFLVMELVEGRTLRELIRERGHLGPAQAVSVMEPVLSALAAAHRAGVVHRDIKPENILLSDDGIVKVADFGLARAAETDAESTRTGLMMGTVAYCAPETIVSGQADPSSDVYAAGVVLFELLTGSPPFSGESAINVAYQHVHGRVPAPSSRLRGLPEALDEVVVAATDRDPAGRPSDAGALLAELAEVRRTLALPVTPIPPRERPQPRAPRIDPRRGPQEHTTSIIGHGGAARHDTRVVPDSTGRRPLPDEDAPPPPVVIPADDPRRRRRRRALILAVVLALVAAVAGVGGWWLADKYFHYIPDVLGMPRDQAVVKLQDAGYQVAVQPGSVVSESIPSGDVASLSPSAGTRLTSDSWLSDGQTVRLTLSAGPRLYTVPVVQGLTEDQARTKLLTVGPLSVAPNVVPQNSDTVPSGQAIGTSPAAGVQVDARQTITIYMSVGPPMVAVPQIASGTPVGQAKAAVEQAGLVFDGSTKSFDDSAPAGTVVSCDPASGQARKGSTVSCIVSRGPTQVPAFQAGTRVAVADMEKQIVAAQLVPKVAYFGGGTATGSGDPGYVLALSPNGGQQVPVGSTVTIYAIG